MSDFTVKTQDFNLPQKPTATVNLHEIRSIKKTN
jgi:hypothetical protein